MRSRLWMLILRELPFPLRWLGTEVIHLVQWIDASVARFLKGLRDAPAWYFVTSIGSLAVFLTVLLFISIIDETSGRGAKSASRQPISSLSRRDLEKTHDWSVQDRWRVAHLFVMEKPVSKPRDLPLDTRLMAATSGLSQKARTPSESTRGSTSQFTNDDSLEVRLDLSRPKKAQQSSRLVRGAQGTVLDKSPEIAGQRSRSQVRSRDSRVLVQASWEFGNECSTTEYIARPTPVRRQVPVPLSEPEPERPKVIVQHESPSFLLEMAMVRHFSVEGLLPPGSHLVNHSSRSSNDEHERRFQSELVSHNQNAWKRHHPSHADSAATHSAAADVTPYIGGENDDPSPVSSLTLDEYEPMLRSVADIDLNLILDLPESVSAANLHQIGLTISNEGQDQVSRIEVNDDLSHFHTVVGANPDAASDSEVDPITGERTPVLHREISNLIPGERQEMSLKWIPVGHSRQVYRARVIAHAEISTTTDVLPPETAQQMPSIPPERIKARPVIIHEPHPAVVCDVEHLDRVTVGKDVELEITVRNTGDTPLHHVKVMIDLPEQLSHRDGRKVIFDAGNLPRSGRNRTVIKLSALRPGEAMNLVRVETDEAAEAHGKLVIHVDERRKAPSLAPKIEKQQAILKSRERPPIAKDQPAGECCCQKIPIIPGRLKD